MTYMQKHWDVMFGAGGILTTLTLTQVNQLLALGVGLLTLFVMMLRARREWRSRNKAPEDKP